MTRDLASVKRRYPTAETFKFGDSAAMSDDLISLVRSGRKVATCSALHDYRNGEPMPVIGRRDIALNWNDTPALVIETVDLVQCRFDEVTEAMALAEGEDENLEGWRRPQRLLRTQRRLCPGHAGHLGTVPARRGSGLRAAPGAPPFHPPATRPRSCGKAPRSPGRAVHGSKTLGIMPVLLVLIPVSVRVLRLVIMLIMRMMLFMPCILPMRSAEHRRLAKANPHRLLGLQQVHHHRIPLQRGSGLSSRGAAQNAARRTAPPALLYGKYPCRGRGAPERFATEGPALNRVDQHPPPVPDGPSPQRPPSARPPDPDRPNQTYPAHALG